jgi:integration host factor subunit alpha
MKMTKIKIINMICEHIDMPKTECFRIIESVLEIIKSELEKGNDVKISGFGKWAVNSKKARKGRNPQTGQELTIAARKVVTFKASPALKDELNT